MHNTNAPALRAPGVYRPHPLDKHTPWGTYDSVDIRIWGADVQGAAVPLLWQVGTPSHGGVHVHPELADRFLKGVPPQCHKFGGSPCWYEQDCEACVPLFVFYNALTTAGYPADRANPFPREKLLAGFSFFLPDTEDAVTHLAAAFDEALRKSGVPLRSPLAP